MHCLLLLPAAALPHRLHAGPLLQRATHSLRAAVPAAGRHVQAVRLLLHRRRAAHCLRGTARARSSAGRAGQSVSGGIAYPPGAHPRPATVTALALPPLPGQPARRSRTLGQPAYPPSIPLPWRPCPAPDSATRSDSNLLQEVPTLFVHRLAHHAAPCYCLHYFKFSARCARGPGGE